MFVIRSPKNQKEWDEYYDLRYRLLREAWGQKRGSEKDEGDSIAKHFAVFDCDKIIAVSRLDLINKSSQIRYFAVEFEKQNMGLGKKLLDHIEKYCKEMKISSIILQARETALPFYLKNNYKILEKSHLLFDSIQHFKMGKNI